MVHQTPPKRISNTVIPSPEAYLQERTQEKHNLPDFRSLYNYSKGPSSRATEAALLKYYPKYCRFLSFDKQAKSQPVLARIKQIKILENIEFYHGNKETKSVIKKMKLLLRNKRKSFKSLPIIKYEDCYGYITLETFTILEICSFFPRIKDLKIFPPPSFRRKPEDTLATRPLEKKMLRLYDYFWGSLRSVQHLEISNDPYNLWVVLPWLQSSKRFLTSLKTFSLGIDIYYGNLQRNYPRVVFQTLLKYQDLLKYVTRLTFSGIQIFNNYGAQIKAVLDSCPSLISLSFPIGLEFNRADRRHLTLAPLQSLQNIRILELNVNDIWDFIQAFEFPRSLQKLVLDFVSKYAWLRVWHTLYSGVRGDQAAFESYENYKVLLHFFEKFKQLTLLASLNLIMPGAVPTNEVTSNFILPMLRATPKVENFECQFFQVDLDINNHYDLSVFLDGITPLQQLKSWKISQRFLEEQKSIRPGDLVTVFIPLKAYYFPNITSVYIDNWISEDFDFKEFFKMFLSNLKEVTLSKIYLSSVQSFIHLLEVLSHFGCQFSAARIKIGIVLSLKRTADLDYLRYPLTLAKNVSIRTSIEVRDSEQCLGAMKVIREAPSNIKIDIYTVESLF